MDDGCGGVDHGFATSTGFVRSHGDALAVFDLGKEVLDEAAPFICRLVDLKWCASLRSLRNNDFRAAPIHFLNDLVGIISFIRCQTILPEQESDWTGTNLQKEDVRKTARTARQTCCLN